MILIKFKNFGVILKSFPHHITFSEKIVLYRHKFTYFYKYKIILSNKL